VARVKKMKKSFTLIELVVAVALLAIVFLFAGTIFKVSINAYRTAVANAEIIQKLRAITDQLNADFKGIRTDAPLLFWFHEDTNDPSQRYDQIMFFADGDFQSTQLYDGPSGSEVPAPTGDPVVGNVARIHYGQAKSRDPADDTMKDPFDLKKENRLLARRQHILTADTKLAEWPHADMLDFGNGSGANKLNERYEHDSLSLAQWKIIEGSIYEARIIPTCFTIRPLVDMGDPNTFHKLMCEGVGSFAIQWAYWDSGDKRFYWFPSDDHFILIGNKFGVYFNVPGSMTITGWDPIENVKYKSGDKFLSNFYPKAIKFTFRLYDSKGIIKEGREFTHIVYIGD
jgi:type II secretory pathway pseudopilin PulG